MKANHHLRASRAFTFVLASIAVTLAGACSRPSGEPTPVPTARPPAPAPLPPKPAVGWQDAPITPGDWEWSGTDGSSTARFAGGRLTLRCERPGGTLTMALKGSPGEMADVAGRVPVTLTTSDLTRTVNGVLNQGGGGAAPTVTVAFAAGDPVLDALAFSRGRFAVETVGAAPLFVPSWPEVGRVIEDCR